MKKLIVFVLELLFAVGLVGCGIKGKETLRIEFAEWKNSRLLSSSTV